MRTQTSKRTHRAEPHIEALLERLSAYFGMNKNETLTAGLLSLGHWKRQDTKADILDALQGEQVKAQTAYKRAK